MYAVNPDSVCPRCGKVLDGASSATEDPSGPKPGDVSICLGCYAPLKFRSDMTLRYLTKEEWEAMPPDMLEEMRSVIRQLKVIKERTR